MRQSFSKLAVSLTVSSTKVFRGPSVSYGTSHWLPHGLNVGLGFMILNIAKLFTILLKIRSPK